MPRIGLRIIKTSIAVFIIMVLFTLFGVQRSPFYVLITTIICIQPDKENEKNQALVRALGTLIGAITGAIVMFLQPFIHIDLAWDLLNALFIMLTIYLTVLFKVQHMAFMACVAYLSVAVIPHAGISPYAFLFYRVLDTCIGVGVGYLVCTLHLPVKRRNDVLFVAELDDMEQTAHQQLNDFNKTQLNKIVDDGALFTIITKRTPASMQAEIEHLKLHLPVIALDGAILYDVPKNELLCTYPLSQTLGTMITQLLDDKHLNYFYHVLKDDVLLTYYNSFDQSEQMDYYDMMRQSPYRNYIFGMPTHSYQPLYISILNTKEIIYDIIDDLIDLGLHKQLRYFVEEDYFEGMCLLKILSYDATPENMLERLKEKLDIKESIVYGSSDAICDVIVPDNDFISIVKSIHNEYEGIQMKRRQPQ